MVNHGPSKGCNTCRKRKIKCDEERPVCAKCRKSSLACEGYAAKHPFIAQKSHQRAFGTFAPRKGQGKTPETVFCMEDMSSKRYKQSTAVSRIPLELDLSAFQDNIYRTFLTKNFLDLSGIGKIIMLIEPSPVADSIVDALATVYFGQFHHQQAICRTGSKLYVKALSGVKELLEDDSSNRSVSTVMLIIGLFQYEGLSNTTCGSAFAHAAGLASLIEACGPWQWQTPLELRVFEVARVVIIPAAIRQRKRSFLERDEWLEAPWASLTTAKSLQAQIMDLACPIPGFCEDIDKVRLETTIDDSLVHQESYLSQLLDLKQRVLQQIAAVQSWEEQWRKAHPEPYWPVDSVDKDTKYPLDCFGQPYEFDTMHRYFEFYSLKMTTYRLYSVLVLLPEEVVGVAEMAQYQRCMKDAADSLCRSIPYCLDFKTHGSAGAGLAQHTLIDILAIYGPDTEQFRWIARVFQQFWKEYGLGGGNKFLRNHLGEHKAIEILDVV